MNSPGAPFAFPGERIFEQCLFRDQFGRSIREDLTGQRLARRPNAAQGTRRTY